ncbi:MAG: isoleucine--tRNA ligase [Dehalococcoidales bacterium]|nr:isoleucine--tRNA ligase [Dehalococcoidales bacterium]
MFQPVSSKADFAKLEENVLEFWRKEDVFKKSIEARSNCPRFVLYEGPPTANGNPGIHHVLSRVFKDVIPRYKTMKGYYTPRIAGWDTHGLPVELGVEKELGFTSKADIEKYGIAKFNAKCRASVFRYLKEWNAMTERIAYWCDLEHPYITMDNKYIESCWWIIKYMWDKGLVYKGYKTAAHCPRCGTSLSSHEVALGYKDDTEDPSVYIKFRVMPSALRKISEKLQDKKVYLMAWTTTPWTLPGNTALAVAAGVDYSVVEVEGEYIIIATALLASVGLADNKIILSLKGNELVGIPYQPLYNPHRYGVDRLRFNKTGSSEMELQPSDENLTYRVVGTDFVSMEDGTGIVHVAPAFGEVDFEVGMQRGLDFVQPVDLQGKIIGNYSFSGKFVKSADPLVINELKSSGALFRSTRIRHTYPFCWRCDTPLLYYVKQSWYIRTTAVKDRLIEGNNKINWYPEHIKDGRFGDWLQNNVDWAFSRERYWGTPLPVWQCESCGKQECIGSITELYGKDGIEPSSAIQALDKGSIDLHRPFVDDLTFNCSNCQGSMKRVPEVIDCWFDSGAMSVAQYHYPFENSTLLTDGRFPADYICEAVDQTRGWFYSLHALSTLLFDRPCFENVICLGHILDAKGEKMSKTRGNVVEVWPVLNKYGADALRWYLFTASPPGNTRRFSEQLVSEVTHKFMLTLWNVYSFFILYANIDKYNPMVETDKAVPSTLDLWIISELNQLVADVDTALDTYNPTDAGRKVETFVDDLSNWYVRRSRRRFWKSESDTDKQSAYATLYQCLVTLTELIAPFTPFLAEEMYQNLVQSVNKDAPISVHLEDFPVADQTLIDQNLSVDTKLAIKISSIGRAARSKAQIKVRQPLAKILIGLSSKSEQYSLERVKSQVIDELNVKDIEVVSNISELENSGYIIETEGDYCVAINPEISPELLKEGLAREIVHRLQTMRREADFEIVDHITTYYEGDEYVEQVMNNYIDYIKHETLSTEIKNRIPGEGVYTGNYKISGYEIKLAVERLK